MNEKINIYKDISKLKGRVGFLEKMKKKGQIDFTEALIRVIQIIIIIIAVYVILKGLGLNF